MNQEKILTSYIISNSTYLLSSIDTEDRVQTTIYDKYGISKINQKPLRLVRNTCRLHGTSLEAATQTAKDFFGHNRHKLPIVIAVEYGNPCIFFPLFSPQATENTWVNLHAIINIESAEDETLVTFTNMLEKHLPLHCKSFNQQYVRAMMYYKYILRTRSASLELSHRQM